MVWFDGQGIKPRLACHLLEKLWEGWTPIWSPYGMSGIAQAVGIQFQGEPDVPGGGDADDDALEGAEDEYSTALSVRFNGGGVWSIATEALMEDVLEVSPKKVAKAVAKARRKKRRPLWEDPDWRASWTEQPWGVEMWGDRGVFIDLPARKIAWWATMSDLFPGDQIAANWPEFAIECLGDNYEWHELAAQTSGLQPPLRNVLLQEREAMEDLGDRPWTADPAAMAAGIIEQFEGPVEIPEAAMQHAPSTGPGAKEAVLAELDRLLGMSAPALRPARFIDRDGTIVEPPASRTDASRL
jgi:hypothetical protein